MGPMPLTPGPLGFSGQPTVIKPPSDNAILEALRSLDEQAFGTTSAQARPPQPTNFPPGEPGIVGPPETTGGAGPLSRALMRFPRR